MKKLIYLFVLIGFGFVAVQAQDTKPATKTSDKVSTAQKEVVKNNVEKKKEDCSAKDMKSCGSKKKGCCKDKSK